MQTNYKEIAQLLEAGKIILYPAETIWGIGCDATNEDAVNRLIQLKFRTDTKGLIILLDNFNKVFNYVADVPDIARELVEYSENPLTIIYPKGINLASKVCNQDGSIAIRVVKEGFPVSLLKSFRKPIVSTSANLSGDTSPKNFNEINPKIINAVDYVVDLQNVILTNKESSILKLNINGEFKFIRK